MAVKTNREYRTFRVPVDVRRASEGEEGSCIVDGYASTYEPYVLFSDKTTDYCERIEPDAFDEADISDVIFLYNHQGMVYARVKNSTLKLTVDKKGLHVWADLGSTEESRKMFEAIESGLVDEMSFAFTVEEDEYEEEKGKITRVVKRVAKVYDVSAVSIPANPDTNIEAVSARSAFDGEIERRKAERLEREKALELAKAKYEYLRKKEN